MESTQLDFRISNLEKPDALIKSSVVRLGEQAQTLAGLGCRFILDTDHTPFVGGECLIYAFEDIFRRRFGLRIPRNVPQHASQLLEREAVYRGLIDREQLPRFQKMIAYDASSNNILQAPYIALE